MGDIVQLPRRLDEPRAPVTSRLMRSAGAGLLALHRLLLWRLRPGQFCAAVPAAPPEAFPVLLYQRAHPLVAAPAGENVAHLASEVALLAQAFDGALVTAERPLSLWRTLDSLPVGACRAAQAGRAAAGVGLVAAALARMASTLGWQLVERHAPAPEPRRAASGGPGEAETTVRWPDLDLRIAPREGSVRIELQVRGGALHARVRSAAAQRRRLGGEPASASRPAAEARLRASPLLRCVDTGDAGAP